MALNVKVNGEICKLAEQKEIPALQLEEAATKFRVVMHNNAAQDGSFVDLIINTTNRDDTGYYVLSLMGPQSANKVIFGYRSGAGTFGAIWAIPK